MKVGSAQQQDALVNAGFAVCREGASGISAQQEIANMAATQPPGYPRSWNRAIVVGAIANLCPQFSAEVAS